MKKIWIIALIALSIGTAFSQDLIVTADSVSLSCRITNIDDEYIHFIHNQDGEEQDTCINKKHIIDYKLDYYKNSPIKTIKNDLEVEPLRVTNRGVYKGDTKLNNSEIKTIIESNPAALRKYKTGKALQIPAYIVAVPSAFVFGWDLGTRITGADGNNTLLIVGASGATFGIILSIIGNSQCKAAINLYNSGIEKTRDTRLDFGTTPDGVGLVLKF